MKSATKLTLMVVAKYYGHFAHHYNQFTFPRKKSELPRGPWSIKQRTIDQTANDQSISPTCPPSLQGLTHTNASISVIYPCMDKEVSTMRDQSKIKGGGGQEGHVKSEVGEQELVRNLEWGTRGECYQKRQISVFFQVISIT